jgi:hypothetical protein
MMGAVVVRDGDRRIYAVTAWSGRWLILVGLLMLTLDSGDDFGFF